ncbi:MAG TPA: glycosyltransferase family 4 protein [Bryobacteraceae bacterium]|nr:glycosyltransferase family 4 protein [Bryobacteraceae bacterium]
MRTLHLDSGREMRGGQWQVLRLVEALPREGIAATLLCRGGSPLLRQALERGVDARPLHVLEMVLAARQVDLVHAHDARSHTLALCAGRPLVVSRRVAFPIRSAWKYRRAAHLIAISRAVRDTLIEGGVDQACISVVYDGVPALSYPATRSRVIAPASTDPLKGTDLVREAAALAGVEVRFSTDLVRDLADAALLVYVTRSEGLGSAALLAMSAGVPVVASNVGGLPEAVIHERTGLLTANSAPDIAAAMRRLLDDPALALRMGEQARRTVEEQFSVERMVRGTIGIYQHLCQKPR